MTERKILGFALLLIMTSFVLFSPSLPVNAQEGRARRDLDWYFDNFTAADRRKIRQAFDYSIPRDQIIEDLLQGFALPIATPLLSNQVGYDSTIVPRKYNKSKALDLMEEVFGYRFNDSAETPEDDEGYFRMTLLAPSNREDRMQWAATITKALAEIGVDITLKYANWNIMVPRTFDPESPGYGYAYGGHDGYFFGWDVSPEPDLTCWFLKAAQAPNGCNAHYIENITVEEILNRTLTDPNPQKRLDALQEFQQWFFTESPFHMIRQGINIIASDPALKGVDASGLLYPNYGNWTHANQTTVAVHSSGPITKLNPLISISYFDGLATGGLYEGLLGRFPWDLGTWHGILADKWTRTPDNLVWEVSIKDGIQFSNGANLTVDDVVFSYQQLLNPDVGSARRGEFVFFDEDAVEAINDSAARFTFNAFYPYAEQYLSTVPILSKAEMSLVPDDEWKRDDTNIKRSPLGSGPYAQHSFNRYPLNVTLVKNPYYDKTLRGHDPVNRVWYPNPSIDVIVVYGPIDFKEGAAAIEDLQNNDVDIIDPHTFLVPHLDTINGSSWGALTVSPAYEFQAFFPNQYSPIWGLNPPDPCKLYPWYCEDDPFDDPLYTFLTLVIFFLFSILKLTQIGVVLLVLLVFVKLGSSRKSNHNKLE